MSENEWKKIEPNVWKAANKGDVIMGILVHKEPKDENVSARYYVENADGLFLVWGTAILEDRMKHVQLGQRLRITYNGKTKNRRGQDLNLFDVEVAMTDPAGNHEGSDVDIKDVNESVPSKDTF